MPNIGIPNVLLHISYIIIMSFYKFRYILIEVADLRKSLDLMESALNNTFKLSEYL
jgi:hypothetical protein